jgi:DNA repair exonuclease SbcCD ATPase subunit
MSSQSGSSGFSLAVENIGGIDTTSLEFSAGVNVLSGENATNRTSLLQGIAAAIGSTQVSLKGDADRGRAELAWNGETYVREITERDGTPVFTGEPLITGPDAELAEKFAILFEDNEARRVIEQGSDLREVVMGPVDTDEIERKLSELTAERTRLRNELAEIEELREETTALEARKAELRDEIAATAEQIEQKQAKIDESDADVGKSPEQKTAVEAKLEQLQTKQTERERIRDERSSTNELLETLRAERREYEAELAECSDASDELAAIETEIDELHDRLTRKDSLVSEVQNLIQFNKDMLEEEVVNDDVFAALHVGADNSPGHVTSQLVQDSEEVVCWTCGDRTNRGRISETITRLQDVHEDLYGERVQLQDRLSELKSKRSELAETTQRKEDLEEQLRDIETKIERNEKRLDSLTSEEAAVTETIETLESEIQELRESQEAQVLDLHEELNRLEYEREQLERERAEVEEQLETYRERIDEAAALEAESEALSDEITSLRDRVESLERETVEAFNEHMDTVLELLEYDNIERIWLERKDVERREGRKKVEQSVFDIHVVRQTEDGASYEDTIDHLSESEREVTGLVFALAGNLAHSVYESVPFLVLDSLEAIDSRRIAVLIEYFSEVVDNIVVALLAEDAEAVSVPHERITEF